MTEVRFKALSPAQKMDINSQSVSIQLFVQGLLTEEILTHRHALKKSKFYRQRFKKCLNTAEKEAISNDLLVARFLKHQLEDFDETTERWLEIVREQRLTMYYSIANYYAKQNHEFRGEITIVEYLRSMAGIVKLVLHNINERHNQLGITRANLGDFAIDNVFSCIFQMTMDLRQQLRYKPIALEDDESYKISCRTLAKKINQYLYEGELYQLVEICNV
jgi:hypothetical protein